MCIYNSCSELHAKNHDATNSYRYHTAKISARLQYHNFTTKSKTDLEAFHPTLASKYVARKHGVKRKLEDAIVALAEQNSFP